MPKITQRYLCDSINYISNLTISVLRANPTRIYSSIKNYRSNISNQKFIATAKIKFTELEKCEEQHFSSFYGKFGVSPGCFQT